MSDFDHIEEHRDLVAGLEYEEHHARLLALDDFPDDVYDLDDPKHPDFYERQVEGWDNREKVA